MISPLVPVLTVALVFYVVIPGIGAFGVRRRWRRFRSRVTHASLLPPVTYASVRARDAEASGGGVNARFVGTLESIQGDHTVWVRGDQLTIAVDMGRADVYMVAGTEGEQPDSPPTRTTWSRVGSLPEGVKVLVSGRLDTTGQHPTIRAENGDPVLAVFFDGPSTTLVRRCVWSGRQVNEYWNSVTPGALAGGTFALIILAYLLLRQPLFIAHARIAIALAAVPILPLLPPGVAMFYLYRVAWRRGRILRAHRDVLRLPLRYFTADEQCTRLPDDELYCRESVVLADLESGDRGGLVVIASPVGPPPPSVVVFGHPAADGIEAPRDGLCEWVAVRGDPERESDICQRRARRFEVGSGVILGAGMVINFLIVVILLARLV
jgi:hypothetical protein